MRDIDWSSEKGRAVILAAAAVLLCAAVIVTAVVRSQPQGEFIMPAVGVFAQGQEIVTDGGIHVTLGDEKAADISHGIEDSDETDKAIWLVNINTAGVEGLMLLPGIGRTRAEAIIEYRELNGGFGAVEELLEVDGIGRTTYEGMCEFCRLDGPSVELIEG